MKKQLLISLFSLITCLPSLHAQVREEKPKEITLGIIPGGRPEAAKAQAASMTQALESSLGVPVRLYFPSSYSGLVEALKSQKAQFGFFTAMSYVQAEKQVPVKVLLKKTWTGPFYYSVIVTKSPKIKRLQDLRGKKVAFVDENSTSGYLYPMVSFKKAGIKLESFGKVVWSGNHEKSVQLLESGEVDAIAVFGDDEKAKTGAWTHYSKKPMKVKTLWVSDPIPNDPICVTNEFYEQYPKFTHNLMYAMIEMQDMDKARDKKEWSEILGSGELMPATSRHFDTVREMVKLLDMKSIDK